MLTATGAHPAKCQLSARAGSAATAGARTWRPTTAPIITSVGPPVDQAVACAASSSSVPRRNALRPGAAALDQRRRGRGIEPGGQQPVAQQRQPVTTPI